MGTAMLEGAGATGLVLGHTTRRAATLGLGRAEFGDRANLEDVEPTCVQGRLAEHADASTVSSRQAGLCAVAQLSGEALDRPARGTARQPRSVVCWTEKKTSLCALGVRMSGSGPVRRATNHHCKSAPQSIAEHCRELQVEVLKARSMSVSGLSWNILTTVAVKARACR